MWIGRHRCGGGGGGADGRRVRIWMRSTAPLMVCQVDIEQVPLQI